MTYHYGIETVRLKATGREYWAVIETDGYGNGKVMFSNPDRSIVWAHYHRYYVG